jgi:energy-coupling factor transporter ATP-binding protein EcfA2
VAQSWEEQFDYLLVPANPYRGLEPFTSDQADLFFGRNADIDRLAQRVAERSRVVVIGPSGVGKSSLVLAGLVPRLRRDTDWSVVAVRPGQDPWPALAAGLLRLDRANAEPTFREVQEEVARLKGEGFRPRAEYLRSQGRPLLVVVDQFEEALATAKDLDIGLLDLLLPAGGDDSGTAHRLLITLRADFLNLLLGQPGMDPRLLRPVASRARPRIQGRSCQSPRAQRCWRAVETR